jgi:hypothetical protein
MSPEAMMVEVRTDGEKKTQNIKKEAEGPH